MNLMAKLKAMQREIEALRARVEALEPLPEPIVDAPPIASATIAPPPKKRGRPPKAT